jgi:serine protease Do
MTFKSILLSTAMLFLVAANNTVAQDKKEKKEIIIKGNDKGEQMVIVVDGDNVTLNGKEITGDDNKRVMIMKKPLAGAKWQPFGIDSAMGLSRAPRPQLGVLTRLPESGVAGAEVTEVSPGSAALQAGIKAKDIIQSVQGKKIASPEELVAAIRAQKPGDTVTLELLRDGKTTKLQATLGEAPASAVIRDFKFEGAPGMQGILEEMLLDGPTRPMLGEGMPARKPRLGVQLEETESGKGLKVLEVVPDSPADKSGIKKDDIISQLGDQELGSIDDFREGMNKQELESKMEILRGGKKINLVVRFPKPLRRGRF